MINIHENITEQELTNFMQLWLTTNIDAHNFIDENYWRANYELVKEQLPTAKLLSYTENQEIIGFIGLVESYIAGIFVVKDKQNNGIGHQLLTEAKKLNSKLSLAVYKKNTTAVKFYLAQEFVVVSEQMDAETEELEYLMEWSK